MQVTPAPVVDYLFLPAHTHDPILDHYSQLVTLPNLEYIKYIFI